MAHVAFCNGSQIAAQFFFYRVQIPSETLKKREINEAPVLDTGMYTLYLAALDKGHTCLIGRLVEVLDKLFRLWMEKKQLPQSRTCRRRFGNSNDSGLDFHCHY